MGSPFDTKRQRTIPDISRFGLASGAIGNTSGIDYVLNNAQLTPGNRQNTFVAFDLQLAPLGAQQRNSVATFQSAPLNVIPAVLLGLGRTIEVLAQATSAPCQIEFAICDYEPNPLTLVQLAANSFTDEDRPPVAVAAGATTMKSVSYTCMARYCLVWLRNTGAVNTAFYLSVTARQ